MRPDWLSFRPGNGDLQELPDPVDWPLPGTSSARLLPGISLAILAGLGSAALVGWATGIWEITLMYGGLIVAAMAVAYTGSIGQGRRGGGYVSRALVRAAIASRRDAVAVTDSNGQMVCANAAYGAICGGYPSPFSLGNDAEGLREMATAARRGMAQSLLIHHSVRAGEAGADLRLDVHAVEDSSQHLIWQVAPAPQQQQRKLIGSLIDGEAGQLLGAAGLMVVMTDADGVIISVNREFADAVDADAESAFGQPLARFLDTDDSQNLFLRQRLGRPPIRLFELPIATEATHQPHAYVFLLIRRMASAGATSDRDPSEAMLALIDGLPLSVLTLAKDGRIIHANPAFRAAFRDKGGAMHYPSDLVVDEDKSMVADLVRRVADLTDNSTPAEAMVRIKNAEEPIRISIYSVRGLAPARAVLTLWDNPEQRKFERQVTQATKMQAVGQLAGGVAHDFNNILTAIIGYCDLMLLRHAPGDTDFTDLNQIRQNANRAANLVRQLLAFSRQQTLRLESLQMSDVLAEVANLLKRLLGERVSFEIIHGRDLGAVRADRGQLEQVIMNLAVNARDAMPKGGKLTIRSYAVNAADIATQDREVMPVGDYVCLEVADTGEGISADNLSKIFDPFFTTKEVGKGTGLGLSTVYGIVKQLGGFVFAESDVGVGTSFKVYLPVQPLQDAPAAAPAASPASETRADVPELWGRGRVLLVEDEATVRAVTQRALERKGYDVMTAADGEEALAIYEALEEPIDLLISDVVMPTMDGPALVRAIREKSPELRVILVSGYAEEQLRKSIDLPGVAFLSKPFSMQQLASTVRSLALAGPVDAAGPPDPATRA